MPPWRHYFWETLDSSDAPGNRQFDSGTGEWSFGGPFLNHTTHKVGDDESSEIDDCMGPSTEICGQVEAVRHAGAIWPNWIYPYIPWGPNSNTVAAFIDRESNVDFDEPDDALGWDFPIP